MLACFALIAGLAAFPQETSSDRLAPAEYEVSEAYEVYAAILPEEWMLKVQHSKALLIRAETVASEMCVRPDKDSQEVLGPAIANYEEMNRKTWLLQRKFQIETPYELGSKEDISQVEQQFARRANPTPGENPKYAGWIAVSAVGFNPDKTVAVVYIGHTCGSLCGGGGFRVLGKKDGKWQPLNWSGTTCRWDA